MKGKKAPALIAPFAELTDPRIERQKRHKLLDLLVIAVCAVLCGAESFPAIEDFGKARLPWLKGFLELPGGIPSHDTFNRVFRLLDPVQFQACFVSWMQAVAAATQGEVVAGDGKTLRRSFDTATGAIQMVSAWAAENGVVLGQRKVDADSNEITAIPQLLALLELKGCIVTLDAAGCQRALARQSIDSGAEDGLAVKGNPRHLQRAVQRLFGPGAEEPHGPFDYYERRARGHGREETRR